jgi:hypothetical protein
VAPDIERHGMGVLEWLHDHSADGSELPGIDDYLAEMSLSSDDGDILVGYLADRGLVEDFSTFGGLHARITASGMACVQQLRAKRDTSAQRIGTLRTRMLLWLDQRERQGVDTGDWSDFLAGPDADYYGTAFSKRDLAREAGYLKQHNLITAIDVRDLVSPAMIRPELTANGRDCVVDFGGNVSDYLNRSQRSGHTTHIMMTDSTGNITVASENVVQNVNTGLDTTKLLDFAGFVRQTLPTLGLSADQQQALDAQAKELHQESDSPTPDRGKLRRMVDAILDGLRAAAPTVVQSTAIGLGTEALKAIASS